MQPKVSVLMPSFNHGRFIQRAIDSVLSQSLVDLELIIVDDGSTDNSRDIIERVRDPRVKRKLLSENVGACAALNIALSMSCGEYAAVCSSDDEWLNNKLNAQASYLDAHPDILAAFSDVVWVNDAGREIARTDVGFGSIFQQHNRSKAQWLRDLIEKGNCLCHSSVLIRRDVYAKVGNYDNRFRQLPDLYMWTKVVQLGEIVVMPDKFVKFRWHGSNTSAPSRTVSMAAANENAILIRETFAEISPDNFYAAFAPAESGAGDTIDFEVRKAFCLLELSGSKRNYFWDFGLQSLFELMRNDEARHRLACTYNFRETDLHGLAARTSVWNKDTDEPAETVRHIPAKVMVGIIMKRLTHRFRHMGR